MVAKESFVSLSAVAGCALILASYSCGGGGKPGGQDVIDVVSSDVVVTPDTGKTDTGRGPQCQTEQDCINLNGVAPACHQWRCDPVEGCKLDKQDNGTQCDDQNACTQFDKCTDGQCVGTTLSCDDQNPCTDDSCDPVKGCLHSANDASCSDGDQCTVNDHCQDGQCVGEPDPKCQCKSDEDCKKYDDGDLCNGVMHCIGNQCTVDVTTIVDCSAMEAEAGPCEEVVCDPPTGECQKRFKPDGTECSDGSLCTTFDKCDKGKCVGVDVDCDDQDPCTDDVCKPDKGCVHEPNAAPCDDGDPCTTGDTCYQGQCKGTPDPQCQCDSDDDCKAFDDGDLCNGTMKCIEGKCQNDPSTAVSCDPQLGGPCQKVYCEPSTGQCKVKDRPDGTTCDDGNKCTVKDVCKGGVCLGQPVDCDDKNPCTEDQCVPEQGCVHNNNIAPCDDGNTCTTDDHCEEGKCVGTPIPECQCTVDEDCAEFEDGDLCNGTLVCLDGKCQVDPKTVVECPAPKGCIIYACEPSTGKCQELVAADGTPCDDGDLCTSGDLCKAGKCVPGKEVVCDDGNVCTDDSCNPETGCQYKYNTTDCDDGNPCTVDDHCEEGVCRGTPKPECTCNEDSECEPYDDGNLCNGIVRCIENKCVVDPDTVVSCPPADPNSCKLSYCEPETGQCVTPAMPDGKPCDDGDKCTPTDLCSGGECVGSGQLKCYDGNPCTDDVCDPEVGCTFPFNEAPCDDGDPCTEDDQCVQGVCVPGKNVCGETCVPDWVLSCGQSDSYGTTLPGATENVTSYNCNDWDYPGPEYTYRFTAPYNGKATVYLTEEEAETDILVLADKGQGCNSQNCIAWDFSKVTFDMVEGDSYFFVVDGFDGAKGTYTINVSCVPDHEINCQDGVDDDQDGQTDCDDEDCKGTEACPVPECTPAWTLACGDSDSWWNYMWGSTDVVESYYCNDWTYQGPEYAYTFVPETDGTVTVQLTNETDELDILVLEASQDGKCLPDDNCVAWDFDTVTFQAKAGKTYYLVVDGFNGATSGYTITVDCGQ